MRLWHQSLIPLLPRQQLLGQHRECCALRGNGWGKPHATVNYVFRHHPIHLVGYHFLVMEEMNKRGYTPDILWYQLSYRGKECPPYEWDYESTNLEKYAIIYPEHDDQYFQECLDNLKQKGIILKGVKYEKD